MSRVVDLGILADAPVDLVFDCLHVFVGQRARLAEIEAQAIGRDQRALLCHMLAETAAQRLVQKMGDRMIGAQPRAPLVVDTQFDNIAALQRAVLDGADMNEEIAGVLLRVAHGELRAARRR